MKKSQLFKLICFFTVILFDIIFIILSVLAKYNIFAENISETKLSNNILNCILQVIFYGSSFFFVMGIYAYICFKIMKGKTIIYKDPNKAKTLDNVAFGETFPDGKRKYLPKYNKYGENFPLNKNYFLRKFMICISSLLLLVIILFMINIFYKTNYNSNYYKVFNKLLILLVVLYLLLTIYVMLEFFSDLWCFYVKFFK